MAGFSAVGKYDVENRSPLEFSTGEWVRCRLSVSLLLEVI